MKGVRISYSVEELAWIKTHCTEPRAEAYAKFCEAFGREDVQFHNFHSLCKRNGWHTGRNGRFVKGQVSLTKGKQMPSHPNTAKTQFKSGTAPANLLPMWSERMTKDGYIEMKVPRVNPHTGHKTRFMHKHRYLWEQANGPLEAGMVLKSRDGNKLNTAPENWVTVPRAILPRLNGRFGRDYDAAPAELKPAIMAVAMLEHEARTIKKQSKEARNG